MGRRKQYMDDGSDSSDDEGGRIAFDITDRDLEEEAEGFYGSRKRKRFVDEDLDEEEEDNRGGLGSSFLASKPVNFHTARESPQPTRDPAKERVQKEAKRSPSPAARPDEGFASFSAHSKGFGQKMLEKMGWKMGQGLGASGEGIVNPIETKLRPARMGMGFRGFDERTEQAKEEARLRGESVSDEEEEDVKKTTKPAKREAWKSKAKKPKTVFRTAMDIIAEAELREAPMLTQQKVIDMTGPQVREVSLSEIRKTDSPTWMETTTRLPELRHNLRLIVDLSRGNLEKLSKEKHMNTLQIKAMEEDIFAIRARMEEDKSRVEKAKQIQSIARELEQLSKSALVTGAIEHSSVTALYGPQFQRLEKEFRNDIKTFNLDALVVAVWAPLMKYQTMRWDVLANPTWSAEEVAKWRLLLRSNDDDETNNGYYGSRAKKEVPTATPYEMMMNNIWLTKVRSAINNNWNVRDPDPIVQLLEAWKPPILPRFIFENIVNQLVLPKIVRAVSDWDPRNDPEMIHVWIHPWLPALEAWRLADLFVSIRHKLSVVLRQWHPSDESAIHILIPWKDVWTPDQMEAFLVKSILPKLTRVLRYEFEVNPRDQKLEPLIWCLAWKDILSETILGQLVENEFFNKWLDMLYKWLTLDPDRVDYDEVREWYLWWRQVFSSYGLNSNKSVAGCFRKGLDMMSMAANGEQVKRN